MPPPARTPQGTGHAGWRHFLERHETFVVVMALLAVALIAFFPLVEGRVLFERDILTYWVAQVESFVGTVAAGSWPVWDPHVSFGQPMLAQPDTQVLYPFTWLNLLLPLRSGYSVFVLFHLVLSGVGLFRLASRLGTSRGGALVAAVVWMLSGPFLSLANVWHHFAGAAWMPWVLEAAESTAAANGQFRHVLRWGLLTGLQVLAGSADTVAMTALCAMALMLPHLLPPAAGHWQSSVRVAGGALLAATLGLGLSAVLWVPTLEVARQSVRWSLPAQIQEYWSLHPLSLLQLGLPLFVVDLPLRPEWRQLLFEGREPFLESVYVGLPALVLAAAAPLGRARRSWLLTAVVLLSTFVALGRHTVFHAAARTLFPPLGILRFPQKAMVAVGLALALLAGLGYDRWASADFWKRGRRFALAIGLAALATAGALGGVLVSAEPLGAALLKPAGEAGASYPELWRPVALQLGLAAVAGAGVFLAALSAARGWWAPRRSAAVAAALVAATLLAAHVTLHPTAPAELIASRSPILGVLKAGPEARLLTYDYGSVPGSDERYLGHGGALLVKYQPRGWSFRAAVAYGLQQYLVPPMAARYGICGSFDVDHRGLYSRELDGLVRFAWTLDAFPAARLRLLQLAGVTHVVALHTAGFESYREVARFASVYAEPIRLLAVPEPRPRCSLVDGVRTVARSTPEALVDPGFDFRREVLLDAGLATRPPGEGQVGECRIVAYRPDHVELEVSARRAALAVILDSFDPGWSARVDGRATPVLRADVAFRALPVPPGRHRVEMEYWPRGLTLGLALSALTAAFVAFAGAVVVRRNLSRR